MNLTANDLLAQMRFALPTVLMQEASDSELRELLLTLYRWHVLASRETDQRVRLNHQEAASV